MKKMILAVALILSSYSMKSSAIALSLNGGVYPYGVLALPFFFIFPPLGVLVCGPELNSNVSTVEKTLHELSQNELKGQDLFGSQVAQVSTFKTNQEKMSAYLGIVGVTTDQELVELVGNRGEIDSKLIQSLSKNSQLTEDQSRLVLSRVSESLLGERQ